MWLVYVRSSEGSLYLQVREMKIGDEGRNGSSLFRVYFSSRLEVRQDLGTRPRSRKVTKGLCSSFAAGIQKTYKGKYTIIPNKGPQTVALYSDLFSQLGGWFIPKLELVRADHLKIMVNTFLALLTRPALFKPFTMYLLVYIPSTCEVDTDSSDEQSKAQRV